MKTFRKFIAMFLAVLMLLSIAPVSALADFVREQEGEEYTLQNDYIRVTVNSKNGRFSIRTVEGQPVRKTDQNSLLTFLGGLFGLGETDTSFTTFRINGTDYIFGNNYKFTAPNGLQVQSTMGGTKVFTSAEYPTIPEGCQAVTTQWSVEGVSIIQLLLLYPETDGENSGNVQIFYNIENNSGADVQVGARVLLDTMVGVNDGPEFQIGTISSNTLRTEQGHHPLVIFISKSDWFLRDSLFLSNDFYQVRNKSLYRVVLQQLVNTHFTCFNCSQVFRFNHST